MSVVSKNPFDLLGDDGDESPAPKAAPKAAPAAEAKPKREVPGAKTSTPSAGAASGNAQRGARYPSRGGPRNVYKGDRSPPVQENVPEGTETGVFDGERAPPSRKSNHTRDAHTKGPRGSRPAKTTSGGHTSSRGNIGGARTPAQGGERRQFERRSGALPDSQKKVDQGWGANEGSAELTAEVEGQTDAISEEKAAAAADAWGPDATDAAAAGTADAAAPAEEQEPEEVQKSLTEYLAEKAQAGLEGILGKKEGRTVTAEALEGAKFAREGIDEFFHGKEKTASNKTKAPKKEKVYIAFDGQFAKPAGEREQRGDRREGGRDGNRGGARGGARGGRGQGPRGGAGGARPQGQGQRGPRSQAIDANDTSAFPALGA